MYTTTYEHYVYIYIYMMCMCACTCCVCVYIWHDMYPTTHDDFYTVGHYWILRLSKKTTRTWNPQISWGSVSLCFCRLHGFTVSVFFLINISQPFFPHQDMNSIQLLVEIWSRFHIKQPSRNLHNNLCKKPSSSRLQPYADLQPIQTYLYQLPYIPLSILRLLTYMLWVCNLW